MKDSFLKESPLFEKKGDILICLACRRFCHIKENSYGFCKARFNKNGKLMSPYGGISSMGLDPIEKKPLYHFLPGSLTLSFGMRGCNFKCLYCQNHEISFGAEDIPLKPFTAEQIADIATTEKTSTIVSTYNEPTISIEWGIEVFKEAQKKNPEIKKGIVSNGYFSPQALSLMKELDFIKIDLKSFDHEKFYKLTSANLDGVLESIKLSVSKGFWVEIVTPLVPDFNDSQDEIKSAASFIASIDPEIPWHITAYHPDFLMNNRGAQIQDIDIAVSIAKKVGLKNVYGGNIVNTRLSSTFCPLCGKEVVERGYMGLKKNLLIKGRCPFCKTMVKGVWEL